MAPPPQPQRQKACTGQKSPPASRAERRQMLQVALQRLLPERPPPAKNESAVFFQPSFFYHIHCFFIPPSSYGQLRQIWITQYFTFLLYYQYINFHVITWRKFLWNQIEKSA
jgi:hypothetical protein